MHDKTAFRSAPPPPRTHPGQRSALGGVGVVRVPGSFVANSPFGKPPKQKTSRALEPFWPVRRKQGLRRYDPGCKQPKPPAPELRTTAGSRRRNDCPFQRAGQPHKGERPTRERPASRSTRLLPAPGEGKRGKTAQQAPPDAYPRRGGWRTTRFTSGQLLLSVNRKIPEDLLVELQEFVAMTLSHAISMMKILLVHFNMKYNGKSIILCITRVDFHIPPTSYPHNHS